MASADRREATAVTTRPVWRCFRRCCWARCHGPDVGAPGNVLAIGAVPQHVDIDPDNWQMDPLGLEQALQHGISGVLLTHLYGDARVAPRIARLCRAAGLPLVEDCAQAVGAVVDGTPAGGFGDAAAFSFYPTKNLAAMGDAGAVVTDHDRVAEAVRRHAQHGWSERFVVSSLGRNSRMDELQAIVLRHRLPLVASQTARRHVIRARYAQAVAGSSLRLVGGVGGSGHAAHLTVIELADVARSRRRLAAAGIATDVHYPVSDHHQPRHSRQHAPALPVTDAAAGTFVSVPGHPWLTDDEVSHVADALRREAFDVD